MTTPRTRILVVDDEEIVRESLAGWLEKDGHAVTTAADGPSALAHLKAEPFTILLVDMKMPGMDGLQVLEAAHEIQPGLTSVIMTAYATVETAVHAMKLGAFDYLVKPFDPDELSMMIEKIVAQQTLARENELLRQALKRDFRFRDLISKSAAMQRVFQLARTAANSTSTILILGESGTGKELLARAIHAESPRAHAPFVEVSCAALTETLLESELFGHERGAFTGAIREKRGLFHEADRGTIFLDEIGETSTAMQIKLLRVLQDRVVRRVGSNVEAPVEVRVIAATNRDLAESIQKGTFREDLFYRINVIPITLPPLRQRREDIPLLVDHFIDKFCTNLGVPKKRISADAMRAIEKYHWPGNVRELENVIERMIALEMSEVLTTKSLPDHILLGGAMPDVTFDLPPEGISLEEHLDSIMKIFMLKALERTGGVQTQAAELLHMTFRSFRYYAKKFDLIPREVEVESEG